MIDEYGQVEPQAPSPSAKMAGTRSSYGSKPGVTAPIAAAKDGAGITGVASATVQMIMTADHEVGGDPGSAYVRTRFGRPPARRGRPCGAWTEPGRPCRSRGPWDDAPRGGRPFLERFGAAGV